MDYAENKYRKLSAFGHFFFLSMIGNSFHTLFARNPHTDNLAPDLHIYHTPLPYVLGVCGHMEKGMIAPTLGFCSFELFPPVSRLGCDTRHRERPMGHLRGISFCQ